MKNVFMLVLAALILVSGSRLSHAEQHDDQQCFSVCDNNYDSCVSGVINLPEPRTPEEQQKLDACLQTRADCQHSCESDNRPVEDQPKPDDGK